MRGRLEPQIQISWTKGQLDDHEADAEDIDNDNPEFATADG
jgi:hypothetical protein